VCLLKVWVRNVSISKTESRELGNERRSTVIVVAQLLTRSDS
jgi:hypothetical protein